MASFLTSGSLDENGICGLVNSASVRILASFSSLFSELALITKEKIHSYKFWGLGLGKGNF